MDKYKKKNILKKLVFFIIVISVIAVIVTMSIVRSNKKPVINDYTLASYEVKQNASKDNTSNNTDKVSNNNTSIDDEATGILSPLVKVMTQEDSNKVNAAIIDVSQTRDDITIVIDSVGKDVFKDYGNGDIFILTGSNETIFGEVYISKIIKKYTNSSGNLVVTMETPAIDEVFDKLNIEEEFMASDDNITNIEPAEGVTVKYVNDVTSEVVGVSNTGENSASIDNMTELKFEDEEMIGPKKVLNLDTSYTGGILLEVDLGTSYDFASKSWSVKTAAEVKESIKSKLDLDEYYKGESEGENEVYKNSVTENEKVTEKKTENGTEKEVTTTVTSDQNGKKDTIKYDENGNVLPQEEESLKKDVDKTKSTKELSEKEINELNDLISKISDAGEFKSSIDFSLKGKIGLENIGAYLKLNLDIFNGGLTDLSAGVKGNFITSLESATKLECELGGKVTSRELKNVYKIEGLNQKLLPLFYYQIGGGISILNTINPTLEKLPIACGVLVYTDLSGKITLSATATLEYKNEFEASIKLRENGEWVQKDKIVSVKNTETGKLEVKLLASASARFDIIGAGALISVANINLVEIDVFDIYLSFEGELSYHGIIEKKNVKDFLNANDGSQSQNNGWQTTKDEGKATAYLGGYMDVFRVRLKLKLTILPDTRYSKTKNYSFDFILHTFTFFKIGTPAKTAYKSDWKYSKVAAVTDKYEIYRDSKNKLIRKDLTTGRCDTYKIDNFVAICGIDETFIYLLQDGNNGYNIYRATIDTDAGRDKKIVPVVQDKVIIKDIDDVLLEDDNYFYVTKTDSKDTIVRLKRSDLNTTDFCTIDGMNYLTLENDGSKFYVAVTDPNDSWSGLFGEYANSYYYISKENGEILEEAPEVYEYKLKDYGYSYLSKILVHNFFRNTVSGVSIKAKNSNVSEMETTIGWNNMSCGTVVVKQLEEEVTDENGRVS